MEPFKHIHSGVIHFRPDKLLRVQRKRNPHLCVDLRACALTKLCHWDGVVILVAFKAESDEGRFMEDFLRYKHTVHTPPVSRSSRRVKSGLKKESHSRSQGCSGENSNHTGRLKCDPLDCTAALLGLAQHATPALNLTLSLAFAQGRPVCFLSERCICSPPSQANSHMRDYAVNAISYRVFLSTQSKVSLKVKTVLKVCKFLGRL